MTRSTWRTAPAPDVTSPTVALILAALTKAFELPERLIAGLIIRRHRERRRRQLLTLSDRTLQDIGLGRADIRLWPSGLSW